MSDSSKPEEHVADEQSEHAHAPAVAPDVGGLYNKNFLDKRGRWSPPGGRETYHHSHLSEVPGHLDSDGLDNVLSAPNRAFVTALTRYRRAAGERSRETSELETDLERTMLALLRLREEGEAD